LAILATNSSARRYHCALTFVAGHGAVDGEGAIADHASRA
jgi:hypothetical protein